VLQMNAATVALVVVLASATPQTGTSRAALDAWLDGIPGAKAGAVAPIDDAAIRSVLPGESFYTLRFMRYPRAQLTPPSLRLENLIRVTPGGSVERVEDLAALTKLLTAELPPILDEPHARQAVLACLRLAEEFDQDGHYTFSVPDDSVVVARQRDRLVASGRAVVTKGGKGEITAVLTFDAAGKVISIEPGGHVQPDVRLR